MSKDHICNWLGKCKQKALNSVKNEVLDYLDSIEVENQVFDDIIRLENCQETMKRLRNDYQLENGTVYLPYIHIHNSGKFLEFYGKHCLIYQYLLINQDKKQVWKKHYEEVKRLIDKYFDVNSEYNSVSASIKKMRNVKAMLSYLEGLGFDISTIKNVPKDTINKDLLFVCGDNKPNEPV